MGTKRNAQVEPHSHEDLEKQIADLRKALVAVHSHDDLEKQVADLKKEVASLKRVKPKASKTRSPKAVVDKVVVDPEGR